MLLPLLATRLGLPFLGASPILPGLSDDKHLTKLEARTRGIPTAPWVIYRRGAPIDSSQCPRAERLVIKPNASSASWGVRDATDWNGTRRAIADIQAEGHDAIVEPFLNGSDIEVPVITCGGRPAILPMMEFAQSDPCHLRTYQEKRDLVEQGAKYRMVPFNRGEWNATLADYAQRLAGLFFRSIRAFRVSSQ
jgi:D-alanine-D-alanine ligase